MNETVREEVGSIWTYRLADFIGVPINWTIREVERGGLYTENVMGAGVALQAKRRYPDLELHIGDFIERWGKEPTAFTLPTWDGLLSLIAIPTKRDYRKPALLDIIEQSARQLVHLVESTDIVALPRLGCGEKTGRLDWETQVRPLLAPILDDRFVVLVPEALAAASHGRETGGTA